MQSCFDNEVVLSGGVRGVDGDKKIALTQKQAVQNVSYFII